MMKKKIWILVMIGLVGCAGSRVSLTDVESSNYAYGKTKFPEYTKAMYLQGKTIDQNSCGRCHKLKDAGLFSEEKLNKVVPKMADKAKLNAEDKAIILKYYIAGSKRG